MSSTNLVDGLTRREILTVSIYCIMNVVNYIDRYTISAVLPEIQKYYDIEDDAAGFLQTVFIIAYMVSSPVYGYVGDRYSRKWVIIGSIIWWALMTLFGSVIRNFYAFYFIRMMVGIGEAGFSVIVPSVIADIVPINGRTLVYALYFYGIPVGTGCGMILGSQINEIMQDKWWWALRITPFLSFICTGFLIFGVDPERGAKDIATGGEFKTTSYLADLRYFARNRTFVLITAAFTGASFMTGAMAFWAPSTLDDGLILIPEDYGIEFHDLMLYFGVITSITGIMGVTIGSSLSQFLRPKYRRIDPIICGTGLNLSFPFYFACYVFCSRSVPATLVAVFFASTFASTIWAVSMDILMYVVSPTRRSTGKALETFFSHILGNSISPMIVGLLSEFYKDNNDFTSWHSHKPENNTDLGQVSQDFHGLQLSLLTFLVVLIVSGCLYYWSALYVVEDRETATKAASDK